MSTRPILIMRADASRDIGFGHLARCITLAGAFRELGVTCVFAMSRASAEAARGLEDRFRVEVLDVEPASADDARTTAKLAKTLGAAALVADGYGFRGAFISDVRALGIRCAYIDDYASGRYDCDAILNHNVFAEGMRLDADASCITLLGPAYALIKPTFVAARTRRSTARLSAVPERALVTLGGSDPTGTTLSLIRWLAEATVDGLPPLHARVVLGPAFEEVETARALASAARAHRVEIVTGIDELAPQFEWADLVVGAGGVTSLEAACVGVPLLVVCLAENQRRTAHGLVERGMAVDLGESDELSASQFLQALTSVRRDAAARSALVAAQHAIIDGRGPGRAASGLMPLLGAPPAGRATP